MFNSIMCRMCVKCVYVPVHAHLHVAVGVLVGVFICMCARLPRQTKPRQGMAGMARFCVPPALPLRYDVPSYSLCSVCRVFVLQPCTSFGNFIPQWQHKQLSAAPSLRCRRRAQVHAVACVPQGACCSLHARRLRAVYTFHATLYQRLTRCGTGAIVVAWQFPLHYHALENTAGPGLLLFQRGTQVIVWQHSDLQHWPRVGPSAQEPIGCSAQASCKKTKVLGPLLLFGMRYFGDPSELGDMA